MKAGAGGLEGVMIHTTDGGTTWTPQNTGTTIRFAGIDFVDVNNGWAVGIYGGIFHTSDGGNTWLPQNSGTGELLHAVDFIDLNNGWVTGRGGTILRTTDSGITWHPQTSRTWYDISSVCFIDANNGWVSGDYGAIMHTTDGGGIVSIQQHTEMQPEKLQLLQNYPNPFNPSTVISWQLAARSPVKLTLYNLRGQLIAVLLDELQDIGSHQLRFDARGLANGIYFYRLQTDGHTQTRKMILLK